MIDPREPPLARSAGETVGAALGPALAAFALAGAWLSRTWPEAGLGMLAAALAGVFAWAAVWPWWPPRNPHLALVAAPLAMGLRVFASLGGGWIVADWAGMPQSRKFWLTLMAVFLLTLAAETLWLANLGRGNGKAKNSAEG